MDPLGNLILSVNSGESVLLILPDGRTVEIVRLSNRRLLVRAPKDIKVLRKELLPCPETKKI